MKSFYFARFTALIIVTFIFKYGLAQNTQFNDNFNTFKELKDNFLDPPAKYRTAPFYVWNDEITEQQIDEILSDYKAKGIGAAFIHPRPGLITEYLSDKWYKLFKYAVDKGKSLGMQIWIYDENTYPSGNAGGHLPVIMPESSNQGSAVAIKHTTSFPDSIDKKYFIILKKQGDKFIDITDNYVSEKAKSGDYYLCEKKYYEKSAWYAGNTYVDLLKPEVCNTFIETIMTRHEKLLKDEFGKTLIGMFTDEPGIYINDICWTPKLFEKFQKKWGYDLKLNLPSLNYEVGDWKKVRHDYYSCILNLFINGFCKPYSQYCSENNLIFTGHFLEHDWPIPAMTPDFMSVQAYEGMPGIDNLFNQYDEGVNAQFGNIRMPREVRSVANQMGRNRTLSETYGGAGWDLSFQDMKRIADWQFAGGINFVNQHLSQTTIKGWRKRDYPQSFSSHEPWWMLYKNIVDYTARMSLAMSSGQQMNKILVLEPTTTAWLYFSRNEKNRKFDEIGPAFTNFINKLEKYQIEYDLGSEKNIESFGKVENGKFYIGNRGYDIIVLPPSFENFDKKTLEYLELFLNQGGEVVSYTGIPSFIDGLASDRVNLLSKQYTRKWTNFYTIAEKASLDILTSKDFRIIEPTKIKGKLLHQRRKFKDGELILLTNTSKDYWAKGKLVVKGTEVQELDVSTGKMLLYKTTANGDYAELHFEIPQCGSLLLYVHYDINSLINYKKSKTNIKILSPLGKVKTEITKPNTLSLDYCDLKFSDGTVENDIYVVSAGNKLFKHYGVKDGNPWSYPQYKTVFIDSNKFADNSGFEATYHLKIDKGVDFTTIQASVEQANIWKLSVNGNIVDAKPGEKWLDRNFSLFEIGKFLKEGDNELKIIATKMTIFSELEAIYIIGNFGLQEITKGFKLIPQHKIALGSWLNQGLQMYTNSVSYTHEFKIKKEDKHFIVSLDRWNGSVAEVAVNGKPAGIIYAEPYELDVSDYIIDGENKISVAVYGSLKNLLGPLHSKVQGMAGPGDFANAPRHQPSGNSYNLIDYGLLDDFNLLEISGEQQKYYTKKEKRAALKLIDPVILVDKSHSNEVSKRIIITDEAKNAMIFYTTDGSEPTMNSGLYKKPFDICKNTVVKAFAVKNEMFESNVSIKNIVFGINIAKAVYKNDYYFYTAGGKEGLFDKERGSDNFFDGHWQGFEGNDMDVTFELYKQQKIKKITIGLLENIAYWIYFPVKLEVYISNDGKDFTKIKTINKEEIYKIAGDPLKDISIQLNDVEAKYIRIFAKNIEKCPEGDPGSGGKAWIFTDEVIIE
ncbi:MAG: glycosyl hydrolase [Bacteroidetes bacterium]|nr:glycosyl hydrolase [Bacteroidota bacterium]